MLPQNTLSSPAVPSTFLPPKPTVKAALRDYFFGGNAIGDTSAGLATQTWLATTDAVTGKTVRFTSPLTGTTDIFTWTQVITWLSAAFDQSLRPVVTWIDVIGNGYFYWFDTFTGLFTTTSLPAGVITPYATLDDARATSSSINDALVTYIIGGFLKYRQQRDRFGVEYTLTAVPTPSPVFGAAVLTQVGMNVNFRMQYEFQYPGLGLQSWPPVLLSDLIGAIPRVWPVEDDFTAHSRKAG